MTFVLGIMLVFGWWDHQAGYRIFEKIRERQW